MSEFTAEDFAKASFARHRDGGKAVRFDAATDGPPWQIGMLGKSTDEYMARNGWVPVAEATEATQNRHDVAAHLGQISSLSKRLVAAGDQIESQRIALEDLQEESYRLERSLQAPLSLDRLEVAWEAAEVPTDENPIREGDVVIVRHGGGFAVEPADRILSGQTHGRERILSRAPQREPHENLADAIREVWPSAYDEIDIGSLAYALHERGVGISKNGRE